MDFIYNIYSKIKSLDPLDPLTEIVRSGQAFSPLIFLERFIWLMIGFFFIGAMTSGLIKGIKEQGLSNNFNFFFRFKKSNKGNNSIRKDSEENISQN